VGVGREYPRCLGTRYLRHIFRVWMGACTYWAISYYQRHGRRDVCCGSIQGPGTARKYGLLFFSSIRRSILFYPGLG
jgi:hypothetical protein